ncbi:DUF4105 domain-containing protein [Bisbaumannia pacifica]|uniref:DUF4105 domain-containing protein n=1 Tax=Bisbaumannia pacifica TaxID=77098 RepID=A0ABD4L1Q4_9GAMM|nr:DUF4105 domain-containing protein [Halomonas pacifica]MBH8580556.1 DUF4105 domain-containing protein [Halomonas pacifica]
MAWAVLLVLLSGSWGALALEYRAGRPWALAWGGMSLVMLGLALWGRPWAAALAQGGLHAALLAWWWHLRPSLDGDWLPELAELTHGRVEGERLILAGVRDFRWQDRHRAEPCWETRDYDLARLASVDLLLSNWGLPMISHVMVSFGFDDGEVVTFSVEIRRERGQAFSELAGFFKQYELSIVAGDERDLVGARVRHRDERMRLYRIQMSPRARRELLLAYVEEANALRERPRFYHTVTANCSTLVYAMMRRIVDGLPLDYRLLLTGRLPAYIHEVGGLVPNHSLAELQARADITEAARTAGEAEDFSRRIRQGVPGWE